MAVSVGFGLQVRLAKADREKFSGRLTFVGTASPDPLREEPTSHLFGRYPRVTLQAREVRIECQPTDQPRWWMSSARRLPLAHFRSGRHPLIEGFVERIAREGDVFGLASGSDGVLSLSLYRDRRCILACGDLRDLTSLLSVAEGPDFIPIEGEGLVGRLYRRGHLTRGYIGTPRWGPWDLPPLSTGRGPYLVRFAARLDEGITEEDVMDCALTLARPNLETQPW